MSAETQFTLLGPVRQLSHADLAGCYAYPDPPRTWLRANFISSVDGGATVAGRSGGLGGPGDHTLFHLLRSLADAIVVGAGTVRAENYAGAQPSPEARRQRRDRGQSEVPQLVIISGSGRLDAHLPVFTATEVPPLVLTSAAAAAQTRERLAGLAEVLDCSGADPHRVDEPTALGVLTGRGQHRLLTEGGPSLLGAFLDRGLLDELCLTTAPCLVGGDSRRITGGPGQVRTALHRAHLLADDAGYLYARYVRSAADAVA